MEIPTGRAKHFGLVTCYGNITDAYVSWADPPLGFTDHNVLFMLLHHGTETPQVPDLQHQPVVTQLQDSLPAQTGTSLRATSNPGSPITSTTVLGKTGLSNQGSIKAGSHSRSYTVKLKMTSSRQKLKCKEKVEQEFITMNTR